jgi:hypothetical protein
MGGALWSQVVVSTLKWQAVDRNKHTNNGGCHEQAATQEYRTPPHGWWQLVREAWFMSSAARLAQCRVVLARPVVQRVLHHSNTAE